MTDIRYSKDHEYVRIEGADGVIGISDHAQSQLGDVVYVELPEVGAKLARGAQFGVVESVKAASEVFAPVSGEVTAVNKALESQSALINADPAGKGWMIRIKLDDPSELEALMDEAAYQEFLKSIV
jgi:glycine cleavage system H protein